MAFYKLSEQRVARVMHSPKRIEEGVAPKTVAMMQPASIKTAARPTFAKKVDATSKKETWSQEIWVMVQDLGKQRKIISAWRYPGITKPRSEDSLYLFSRLNTANSLRVKNKTPHGATYGRGTRRRGGYIPRKVINVIIEP